MFSSPVIAPIHAKAVPAGVPQLIQPYGCTGFVWEPPKGSCAHFHTGIDIGDERCGRAIVAAAAGKVLVDGIPSWSLGAVMVRLFHGSLGDPNVQWLTDYYHLKSENVKVGQHVTNQQGIGKMGSTGNSIACHLHFQTKRRRKNLKTGKWGKWVTVNPWPLLDGAAKA